MSYFKIKNNDCDKCNELSQLSFYTKSEIENLIKTMGLAVDTEKIILNLLITWNDGNKRNIIDAINFVLDEVNKLKNKTGNDTIWDSWDDATKSKAIALINSGIAI